MLSASQHCPLCRGTVDTAGLRAPGKNNVSTPVLVKKTKRRTGSSDGEESDYEDGTAEQQPQQQQEASDPNVSVWAQLVWRCCPSQSMEFG